MKRKTAIDPSQFKSEIAGQKTDLYFLSNSKGLEIAFSNYGQRLVSLMVPDKNGHFDDVVLGHKSLADYMQYSKSYFGAIIGRHANRIREGKFTIDGQAYQLETGGQPYHLHGGKGGFHNVHWAVNHAAEQTLEFYRISPHLEEGYPGNLTVKVCYSLTEENELKIAYTATTDKATLVNLTHHSFFNLKGAGKGTINDHLLYLNADLYTPIDSDVMPTGQLASVEGTPFDFRKEKEIGKDLFSPHEQLNLGNGYDHNFVLNKEPKQNGISFAARVVEPQSGRTMEVYTNEPGLQFYGGNFIEPRVPGKTDEKYDVHGAFSLESQHFPDAPHQAHFPSVCLKPGQVYRSFCTYKFGVVKK